MAGKRRNLTTCRHCATELVVGDNWNPSGWKFSQYICNTCSSSIRTARYDPKVALSQRLYRQYGITLEVYKELLAEQNGVCAICQQPPDSIHPGRLCVDHDHETGEIRGLLCNYCNPGIGYFKNDPLRLALAAKYLQKFNKKGATYKSRK